MKKTLIATASALVLGTTLSGLVLAKGGEYHEGRHNPVERMSKALELTPEQESQLETLFDQHSEQRQRQRAELRDQIDALLTPEQLEKRQQMRDRWSDRKNSEHRHERRKNCN